MTSFGGCAAKNAVSVFHRQRAGRSCLPCLLSLTSQLAPDPLRLAVGAMAGGRLLPVQGVNDLAITEILVVAYFGRAAFIHEDV